MEVDLPFFNEIIHSESLIDYYEVDIDIDGNKIQLDLNFDEPKIDANKLVPLKGYLDDLQEVINIAKKEVLNDFETDENVKEYLNFHIDELDQNTFDLLTKDTDQSLSREKRLLSVLKLARIGFYPDNNDQFAVLDFILDREISQYILVVNMNDAKGLDHITMES